MKIYRIIFNSIDIDEFEHTIKVTTFLEKDKAIKYYKELLKELKAQEEELNMDDYEVDENETSYERYLDCRSMEDSVAIWLEEDTTYDELVKTQTKIENEKDKEYEV